MGLNSELESNCNTFLRYAVRWVETHPLDTRYDHHILSKQHGGGAWEWGAPYSWYYMYIGGYNSFADATVMSNDSGTAFRLRFRFKLETDEPGFFPSSRCWIDAELCRTFSWYRGQFTAPRCRDAHNPLVPFPLWS